MTSFITLYSCLGSVKVKAILCETDSLGYLSRGPQHSTIESPSTIFIGVTPSFHERDPDYCRMSEKWNTVRKNTPQKLVFRIFGGLCWPMKLSVPRGRRGTYLRECVKLQFHSLFCIIVKFVLWPKGKHIQPLKWLFRRRKYSVHYMGLKQRKWHVDRQNRVMRTFTNNAVHKLLLPWSNQKSIRWTWHLACMASWQMCNIMAVMTWKQMRKPWRVTCMGEWHVGNVSIMTK